MLIFLYNIGMTIKRSGRFTTTEGVLLLGLGSSAVLYLPALLHYENYVVSIYYRWWTIHLWVEGVWEMIQGSFLDRKSVVSGKSVSVRVDLGGRRIIKKKNKQK